MPPLVTALRPWNLTSCALENNDVLDLRATLDRRIDDNFGRNGLPTAAPLVGGEDHATFAVIDTVTEGLRGKASEHHRVDGTDARTGEEGCDGLPCHGEVDRDGVTFLDTNGFEYIGKARDFVQQLGKGDLSASVWLISFVDDRGLRRGSTDQIRRHDETDGIGTDLVGMFESPTIDAVVRRVQRSFGKPDDIALFKATRPNGLEGSVPVKRLASDLLRYEVTVER